MRRLRNDYVIRSQNLYSWVDYNASTPKTLILSLLRDRQSEFMHVWGIRASTTDSSCPARTPEKCDANADSKCDLFLRNHKPGRRITIDVISGWRCGSGPHRRPVNLGANSLKWEMSDRDFERAAVSMDESRPRSNKREAMKLDYIQHDKEH